MSQRLHTLRITESIQHRITMLTVIIISQKISYQMPMKLRIIGLGRVGHMLLTAIIGF
jgi:hypothetical protein